MDDTVRNAFVLDKGFSDLSKDGEFKAIAREINKILLGENSTIFSLDLQTVIRGSGKETAKEMSKIMSRIVGSTKGLMSGEMAGNAENALALVFQLSFIEMLCESNKKLQETKHVPETKKSWLKQDLEKLREVETKIREYLKRQDVR